MPKSANQKIKLLALWDILTHNTDENNALSTDEIISLLAEKGIEASRKVLPSDIALLNEYGYEVLSYKKKCHYYYAVNLVEKVYFRGMSQDEVAAALRKRRL